MSARAKTLLGVLLIALVVCGATALLVTVAAGRRTNNPSSLTTQEPTNVRTAQGGRNLSLQPEALRLARQLGTRFLADKNTTSVLAASLTMGSEARSVQMIRKQSEDGESVEIQITDSPALSWDAKQGAIATGRQVTENERQLIERLVFDSPDQFVLMQLRGASYYTVARAVRPVDATDGYEGPLASGICGTSIT